MKINLSKNTQQYLTKLFDRISQIKPIEVYAVILVVASVIFATKYFEEESALRLVRVEVTSNEWEYAGEQAGYKVPFWLSHNLEIGQTQRTSSGRVVAEIVSIENYEKNDGQALIYLVVKLSADYDPQTQTYSFQGRPLTVGSAGEFTFGNVFVPVQVVDDNYPADGYQTGKFRLQLKMKNLEPWFVDQLAVGNKMTNRSTGEIIAELKGYQLSPSFTAEVAQRFGGRVLYEQIPNLNDLAADVEIQAQLIDDNWYFAGNQQVKAGNVLIINFDQAPTIVAIIEKLEYVAGD